MTFQPWMLWWVCQKCGANIGVIWSQDVPVECPKCKAMVDGRKEADSKRAVPDSHP